MLLVIAEEHVQGPNQSASTLSLQLQVLDSFRPPGDQAILHFISEGVIGQQNLVVDLAQVENPELVLHQSAD
jgi:hypothetical protein